MAPFAFFVHPNASANIPVPNVDGTPPELVGKTRGQVADALTGDLTLQSYGSFRDNTAYGTWKTGLDLSYFGTQSLDASTAEGLTLTSLAYSGRSIMTTHSSLFALDDTTITATVPNNEIVGIFCNNCNACNLEVPFVEPVIIDNVAVVKGGNC